MKPDLLCVAALPPPQMAELDEDFTIRKLPPPGEERDGLLRSIGAATRFMQTTGFHGADAKLISAFPKLEIIACFGVGVDAVDVGFATSKVIAVTNTPEVLNDCVADLALGLILAVSRRLVAADNYLRAGKWVAQGAMPLATKVSGKKLGILGLGRIGKEIAARAAGFKMEIGYYGRKPQTGVPFRYFHALTGLAAWSDFLVVICPGGAETKGIVNAPVMEALGPKGVLINVARGSVVDEPALVEALKAGKLGGAGLDVFVDEPKVPAELMSMENVVLVPHIGSATTETRKAMADLVVANLKAHLRGEKLPTRYN